VSQTLIVLANPKKEASALQPSQKRYEPEMNIEVTAVISSLSLALFCFFDE
jgi:hypothetical protein